MVKALLLFVAFYLLLRLFSWIFSNGPKKATRSKGVAIRLAVAIPAHNEEMLIGRTIKSLLNSGMQPQDIFVLPNCCTDQTEAEIVRSGLKLHVIPKRGKAAALNYAVHELRLFDDYTHVCLLDADTLVDKGYFKAVRNRLRNDPAEIVCGAPKSLPFNGLTAHRAVQYWTYHVFHKPGQERIGSILVVPGCAGIYSTSAIKTVRWSNDTSTEDMDATIQLVMKGKKIAFENKAIVYTQDPSNLRDYVKQLSRWYSGFWMNMRKHGILWRGPFSMFCWDCRIAVAEQLLFIFFLIPYRIFCYLADIDFNPQGALLALLLVIVINSLSCAILCAFDERRWDILKPHYLILYPAMVIIDSLLAFRAILSIISRSRKNEGWYHPQRY